jgi:hypothetical protein
MKLPLHPLLCQVRAALCMRIMFMDEDNLGNVVHVCL